MATKDKKSKVSAPPARPTPRPEVQGQHRFVRYCFILALSGLVLLAWLSLLSFSPTDQPSGQKYPPEVNNAAGVIGSYVAYFLRYWVGGGAYMGLLFASVAAFILILGGQIKDLPWRIAGTLLLVAATSSAAHLARPGAAGDPFHAAAGVLGMGLGSLLKAHLGSWGAWIAVVVSLCTGMMLAADNLVLRLPGLGKKAWQNRPQLPDVLGALKTQEPLAVPAGDKTIVTLKPRPTPARPSAEPAAIAAVARPASTVPEIPLVERPAPVAPVRPAPAPAPAPRVQVPRPAPKPAKVDKRKDDYILPSADLLAKPTQNYSREQDAQAQIKQAVLQQTLDDFNVAAQVVGYQTGPVITLFELSLSAGVKVSQ
ncbi:MAG: DNA translocase FtsK 4TM domain-containing protein, partial [Planctomycetaceae bacterium]|nr:DNA translocase FtsK 4TM domain-containing protein [Planctomycetaceae bacterium]